MTIIWATRGRTWGFRFIRHGGYVDPLTVYDDAFSGVSSEEEVFRRAGETVALRFPDPIGRKDRAGRVIAHDFVVLPPLADGIESVEDGRRLVWPLVADEFAAVWKLPEPRSRNG